MPKLKVNKEGKVVCRSDKNLITYNSPFPTHNGTPGGFSEPAHGYVIHTEVGYEHNVIAEFNNPAAQASAFFSIGMDGHIHQYGPVGKGWKAWTQVAGNTNWRGVEHEDHGNVKNPLTPAQIESSASLVEVLSRLDKFPIQPTDNVTSGKGVAFHSDGGEAWGGHDCPGAVRRAQRPSIIHRAKTIRSTVLNKPKPTLTKAQKVRALQRIVHVPVTGKWNNVTTKALYSIIEHKRDKFEQAAVGAKVDGAWGPQSQKNYLIAIHRLQRLVGAKSDGVMGQETRGKIIKFVAKVSK